jgi:23S rRNA-/tRNA-specific pseudouridylate synthase
MLDRGALAKSAGRKHKSKACSTPKVSEIVECKDCLEKFTSRNKMFIHIRETHDKLKLSADETSCNQLPLDLNRFLKLNSIVLDNSIRIVGEDSSYRVVVKPQGLPTMGKVEEGCTSLMRMPDMLLPGAFELNLPYKKAIPCHRLDSSTGGLVVCSKTRPSEVCIKMCFRQKLIHKRYRAIVPGRLEPKEGVIATPCGGKDSITKYNVVDYSQSARYGWISTVDCWPVTGRKHQIRKHLLSVGHAILGDRRSVAPYHIFGICPGIPTENCSLFFFDSHTFFFCFHRYSHASTWPERIGNKELMFLWSLEVEFPHPVNANSEAENEIIRNENLIKISMETAKGVDEKACEDPEIIGENDEDDCEVTAEFTGNTTSGGDLNSVENRLLMSSATQIREEMYGIEKRRKVQVVIDEPTYYETFRGCHREEWMLSQEQEQS